MPRVTPRRLLLGSLVLLLALLEVRALLGTVLIPGRFAVDMEIPLRAATRWLAGDPPYLASAFTSPPGATQPFLYPPYTLPVFGLLTALPRLLVGGVVVTLLLLASVAACRRLGVPWPWLPLALAWPPFAEAIYGANIQALLILAFVLLFFDRGAGAWSPHVRDIGDPATPAALAGGLGALVGSIKVSQPHAWLYILRQRPRAAIGAAAVVVVIVAATIPITGIGAWFDWVAQLRLASDVTWDLGGFASPRFLPPGVGYVVAGACVLAIWRVPAERAGAWIGLLAVVGSLSLHIFGLLFLVPAMLAIRREAALAAAIFIATYSYEGAWVGIGIVAAGLALVEWHARTGRGPAAEQRAAGA